MKINLTKLAGVLVQLFAAGPIIVAAVKPMLDAAKPTMMKKPPN